jgi:hypothetical protein
MLFREDENYKFYEIEVRDVGSVCYEFRECGRISGEDMEKCRAFQENELSRVTEFIEKGIG